MTDEQTGERTEGQAAQGGADLSPDARACLTTISAVAAEAASLTLPSHPPIIVSDTVSDITDADLPSLYDIPSTAPSRTLPENPDARRAVDRTDELKERHYNHDTIVRMLVKGMKHTAIAAVLQIGTTTVSKVANSKVTKAHIDHLSHQADKRVVEFASSLQDCQSEALALLQEVAMGKNVEGDKPAPIALRVKTAADLLDRGGNGPVRRVESTNTNVQYTRKDIIELKVAAQEEIVRVEARTPLSATDIEATKEEEEDNGNKHRST